MEKYNPKIQKELIQIYLEKFWPKWRRELFGELYRTFHPSTYEESFSTPTSNFIDMLDTLEDKAVQEGVKLGLINPDTFNSFPRLDGELIIDEGANLDWVHGMLLYSVIYDLVMDFRCYQGTMGIDPNCEGKYMNDFNCLKQVYEKLYDYMLKLEEFGVPVGELIGQEKLKKIPLVDLPVEQECGGRKDIWNEYGVIQEALEDDPEVKYLLDNIDLVKVMKGPDAKLISDYVEGLREWGRYNMIMTELSPFLTDPETVLKGELSSEIMQWATENESWPPDYEEFFNQQEDPLPYLWAMRQKIRDAMTRLTMRSMEQTGEPMDMDNVNKIFRELAKRIYVFVLRGPHLKMAQDRKRRLDEADELNPPVQIGDVIELLHLEDPYSPIPLLTKGIVVGFDKDPLEDRLLVRWIIDPDGPEFKNMPLYPSIDAYRLVRSEELLEESIILNEQQTQEINYTSITDPKFYGRNQLVFLKTKDKKLPGVERLVLNGPTDDYPTISIDSYEVKDGKYGGLQVNYNNNTRGDLDLVFNRRERNQPEPQPGGGNCNYNKNNVLKPTYWCKTCQWRKKLQSTIRKILNQMYSQYKAPDGLPTPYHLKNGFINVPGTDAYGTTHGWSILNFFETNSNVRKILIEAYAQHKNDNNLNCWFNIDEFTDWLKENKNELFGMGKPVFNKLVEKNTTQWEGGQIAEQEAAKYLSNLYGSEWEPYYSGEPGIFNDAITGVDVTMIKTGTNIKHTYQVKPFRGMYQKNGQWWVESYDLQPYNADTTKYFFFGPSQGKGYIFNNDGQGPTIKDNKEYYVFNTPEVVNPETINESVYKSFWN